MRGVMNGTVNVELLMKKLTSNPMVDELSTVKVINERMVPVKAPMAMP